MAPPRKCNCNAPGCLRCYRREWGRAYRKKAYGTYQRHGNLDQVRAHIETLRDSGISLEALAEAIGGSRVNLQRIAAGKTARISRQLADRILAAEPRPKSYPGWMVQRRLRAAASDRARTWQAVREHGRSRSPGGRWYPRTMGEVREGWQ